MTAATGSRNNPAPTGCLWFAPFIVHNLFAGIAASSVLLLLNDPLLEVTDGAGLILLPLFIVMWLGGMMLLQRGLIGLTRQPYGPILIALQLIAEAGLAVALIAYIMPLLDPHKTSLESAKRFEGVLDEYVKLEPSGDADGPARLSGRCVLVATRPNRPAWVASDMLIALPPSMRARSPEEVTTIVQLRYGSRKLPIAPDAIVESCDVRIILVANQQLLGAQEFEGKWRQVTYKNRGRVWEGSIESVEITRWLRGLPRR